MDKVKKNMETVRIIANNSERWSGFSDERLLQCIDLCAKTWNEPTEERISELTNIQLIEHDVLNDDKKRKLRMQFETYKPGDEFLKEIFNRIKESEKPTKADIQEAVIVLDSLYSTRLQNVMTTSENIYNLFKDEEDFGSRIKAGDYSVVDDITEINQKGKDKKYYNKIYSFATKFCSFINPSYRIFDKFSANMLYLFLHKKGNSVELKELGNYSYFCDRYDDFLSAFKIEKSEENYKRIDIFLWMYGKVLVTSGGITFDGVSHINKKNIE